MCAVAMAYRIAVASGVVAVAIDGVVVAAFAGPVDGAGVVAYAA